MASAYKQVKCGNLLGVSFCNTKRPQSSNGRTESVAMDPNPVLFIELFKVISVAMFKTLSPPEQGHRGTVSKLSVKM